MKEMRYRIVKEETLSLTGTVHIVYYPEYKGWFGWNRFVEYDIDCCSVCAGFDKYEDAKAFLNNHAHLKGMQRITVVSEYVYGKPEEVSNG